MTELVRAYVNARPVDVPVGGTALDAVRAFDPAVADGVAAGARGLADSRGLPLDPASAAYSGLIIRIVSGRARDGAAAPTDSDADGSSA